VVLSAGEHRLGRFPGLSSCGAQPRVSEQQLAGPCQRCRGPDLLTDQSVGLVELAALDQDVRQMRGREAGDRRQSRRLGSDPWCVTRLELGICEVATQIGGPAMSAEVNA
jgi:hypothetical protein